uniref:medium-chain acyl-CoA ligase n=1 Tax=Urocitellus parryii TaxID=9999 RepID=A0A8D2HAI2_UROPR|nr:acyl-coenzyme A synthetase ACSM1, mitochondrial [Urocitellus parryii]XP_026258258.1 acyl-coenzyme A synthetase ACSM1, mitochondrial [Urocitellus parryii]XP_026258259.1 acyl-coenzyme A synthetase ACSM1, mitochondrial [Urocitellus parryii]XP_026258260.1 acyl-coenzyme A synthetase ACSM1, mitochondrial [Urocitellus parryii]
MQWLMRFRILCGIHKSFHIVHPAPRQVVRQSSSGLRAPRWSDHDTPEEFNFASSVVDYWAQMEKEGKRGSETALWWVNGQGDEVKWSFREIADLTRRTANVLTKACGLQQGDHLALILPRVPEWWLVTVGCIRTGIVFIPGTTQLTAKDIVYRLQASKAKAIVTTDTLAPAVDSVASECPTLKTKLLVSDHSREGWLDFWSLIRSASPSHTCIKSKTWDPMVIFFTSGTTGLPKMAKHSHGLALRSCLSSSRKVLQLKTSDLLWCMSDPGWILALVGCQFEPWTAGSTIFVHHLAQLDPKVIVQVLFKYPITQFLAAPSVFRMILQEKFTNLRFPTLEHCGTGGEALLPEELEQWRRHTGLLLHELYGQSETGMTCAVFRGMNIKPGSMGKAVSPFDIQIIDDKGNILPPNTEGNMGIRMKPTRPPGLFMYYENNPKASAKVECGDFYNTGDRATMDAEGYLWFLGRDDDIINASGYRIGPTEVENALAEHPAVAESAVVSSPDPKRGEVVKAFIVLNPEFLSHDKDQLTKELQQHVKSVTAPYKYPRKVEFVLELPKTITGKIKRSDLRKKEFGGMSSGKKTEPTP